MDQKSDYSIDFNGTKLWLSSNFGPDGKIANPVLAKVYAVGDNIKDLKPDDFIVCHHNCFLSVIKTEDNGKPSYLGDTGVRIDGLWLFCIDYGRVQVKIDKNGDPIPLDHVIIAERLPVAHVTSLVAIPDSIQHTEKNYFKVLQAGKNCEGVKGGCIVVTETWSDYQLIYTFGYQPKTCIRIKYSDVMAVKN